MPMKLVVAIIQSADSGRLIDALVSNGFRSTRLSTVGGFLDEPNVTMLIGTEDEQVPALLELIHRNCHARRRYMNATPMAVESVGMPIVTAAPIEVEVGGAAVFMLPVRHIARLGRGSQPTPTSVSGAGNVLLLAVVQVEDIQSVTTALVNANYRFTRIDSIGGFLRKGNATLLIGIKASRVDDVLDVIDAACRQRAEPTPVKSGLPSYSVTAFIIDLVPFQ
jgi:uncharacterized protein YaaQ